MTKRIERNASDCSGELLLDRKIFRLAAGCNLRWRGSNPFRTYRNFIYKLFIASSTIRAGLLSRLASMLSSRKQGSEGGPVVLRTTKTKTSAGWCRSVQMRVYAELFQNKSARLYSRAGLWRYVSVPVCMHSQVPIRYMFVVQLRS